MATAAGTPTLAGPKEDRANRVVVFAVPDDTEALLSQFQQLLGITTLDARIRLHGLPGILRDKLSSQDAEALVGAIQQLGVDAQVLTAADYPDLSHAVTVHHVRCSGLAFEIVPNPSTAIESIGWDRVGVISVADVPLDGAHHATVPRTVMVRSSPRKNDAAFTTPFHGVEMWIIVCREYNEDPVFRALVQPTQFAARRRTIFPARARAKAVPMVGWPAKSSSRPGVKMRTRAAHSGRVGGRRNAVSDRFISRAICCNSSSVSPTGSGEALDRRGRVGAHVDELRPRLHQRMRLRRQQRAGIRQLQLLPALGRAALDRIELSLFHHCCCAL